MGKQLLIAGGRNYRLTSEGVSYLKKLHVQNKFILLLNGMARGIDEEARKFAKDVGLKIKEFPADWSRGKRGGYERNLRMSNELCPNDVVLLFPGGKGTDMMFELSKKTAASVIDYRHRMDLIK